MQGNTTCAETVDTAGHARPLEFREPVRSNPENRSPNKIVTKSLTREMCLLISGLQNSFRINSFTPNIRLSAIVHCNFGAVQLLVLEGSNSPFVKLSLVQRTEPPSNFLNQAMR
jgi:hypothetical protein